MNIDWGNKYIRMSIIFVMLTAFLSLIISLVGGAVGAEMPLFGVILFSALVSGLAATWIFRNVFE